jgi:hypothetical protein
VSDALHFSLFAGVKFLVKALVLELKYSYDIMQIYLKFFFDNYTQRNNLFLLQEIVRELPMSEVVPAQQSKYLLYLFYALFQHNALDYYFKTQLFKKLRFDKGYLFKPPPEKHRQLLILEEFYNTTQVIHLLLHCPEDLALVSATVSLSLKNQRPENAYLILYTLSQLADHRTLEALDGEVVRECLSNPTITAAEYFNVRAMFVVNSLQPAEERYSQNVRLIFNFLEDLIALCKARPPNTERNLEFMCQCWVEKIYLAVPHRAISGNWVIFIAKLKELREVSNGFLDFFQFIKTSYTFFLDRNLVIDYLKVLLKAPLSEFDKTEAAKVVMDNSFTHSKLKSLLFDILKEGAKEYFLEFVE